MSKFQVVRYKSGKHTFEVMTKLGSVLKYRAGELGFTNVLEADIVRTLFIHLSVICAELHWRIPQLRRCDCVFMKFSSIFFTALSFLRSSFFFLNTLNSDIVVTASASGPLLRL